MRSKKFWRLSTFLQTSKVCIASGGAMAAFLSAPAMAQSGADEIAGEDEIIVTGTLIRGVAPTGTNLIGVSREDVTISGAASTNDLLASIPQVGNFGSVPSGTAEFGNPLVRPNIRNLGASGGNTTLVLLNGHRIVGAGILQTTADPSFIPPGVIERVEVVPDGGSSIYGSDAIGGVINFITRKELDGIEGGARYGFADDYQTLNADATIGKVWDRTSALLSYSYAWHDNILGMDRDYVGADHTDRGGSDLRDTVCSPGNITIGDFTFALPDRVPGTLNQCDQNDYADLYPREERHSVFGTITHEFTDALEFSTTGYWSVRNTDRLSNQAGVTGLVTAANPYFQPVSIEPAHNIAVSFADVFGPNRLSDATFKSYGVTPTLTYDVDGNWQVRAEANFGRSFNEVRDATINAAAASAALSGTTMATALNPYDPGASDPALLAVIGDFENYGKATQEMATGRVVVDGALATLPGGDLRLAVGGEYHYENVESLISQDPRGVFTNAISSYTSRNIKSIYGELLIPIFGEGNAMPGLQRFEISASVRYDDYNDVGDTTNPKIGFNYEPFADFVIRGNYGTSFHAPSLADTTSTTDSRGQILLFSPFRAVDSSPLDILRPTIVLAGGNPNLKPEEAETWSLGFDWTPQEINGLQVSATYYNVDFTDAIGLAPFTSPLLFSDPNLSGFYIINPTLEESLEAVGDLLISGAPSIEALYVGTSPYVLIDARRNNLGGIKVSGIDFDFSYMLETGFGSVDARVAGTYTLKRKRRLTPGAPFSDDLENGVGNLGLIAELGARIDNFIARATLNYRDSYPILGVVNQTKVESFTPVDLFLGYTIDGAGPLRNTMLTFNVDNVFEEDPSYINTSTGYTNGSTLGRVISFGVRKRF